MGGWERIKRRRRTYQKASDVEEDGAEEDEGVGDEPGEEAEEEEGRGAHGLLEADAFVQEGKHVVWWFGVGWVGG